MEALTSSDTIIVCPSNPFISIGPILAVPGIREAVRHAEATVVAVSPVVGGQAIKGPTAAMLGQLGHEVSAAGVAAMYADILDTFILDIRDEALRCRVLDLGLAVRTAETIMNSEPARMSLARMVMEMVL
jgi:LPPG:FO 2-phospho-L-lactate transferase